MNNAFYTGASGLRAHQNAIDVTSHNLTNCNTYGYKATKPEFRELLNNNMDINKNRELQENEKILKGHGVKMSNQDLLFTQGSLENTGNELDFAIAGDGLFALDRDGEVEYTRNGNFDISIEEDAAYLVSGDGAYVLDQDYNKITVPYKPQSNVINSDGLYKQLGVFNFSNPYGLRRMENQSFQQTAISGDAEDAVDSDYSIYEQSLERSNVNVGQEFADVILSQKAYQFSARVVTTADEIEQLANSLRKA